jgi:hypothetical protein
MLHHRDSIVLEASSPFAGLYHLRQGIPSTCSCGYLRRSTLIISPNDDRLAYNGSWLDGPHHDGTWHGYLSEACGYLASASANAEIKEMIRLCTNEMLVANLV